LGPVNPTLQVQAVITVLVWGEFEFELQLVQVDSANCDKPPEYLPVPQKVHAADPVAVLYVPARHPLHVPPLGPVNPRLQVQAVCAMLV